MIYVCNSVFLHTLVEHVVCGESNESWSKPAVRGLHYEIKPFNKDL